MRYACVFIHPTANEIIPYNTKVLIVYTSDQLIAGDESFCYSRSLLAWVTTSHALVRGDQGPLQPMLKFNHQYQSDLSLTK